MSHRRNVAVLIATLLLVASASVARAQESVLYSFLNNASDGAVAQGGLVFDAAGNLYGTTAAGGNGNHGTVFELSPGVGGIWTETVLYRFGGANVGDGGDPTGTLLIDAEGNLYGTASAGNGVIFELLAPAEKGGAWAEKVLWAFGGQPDGQIPEASLIFDAQGNLYGVTEDGGTNNEGAVFELSPGSGGVWTEQLLYSFESGSTGNRPQGGLVFDTKGNLYGTTVNGGTGDLGVVYELSPPASGGAWTETVVHQFDSLFDGGIPEANLVLDSVGNLYGTASQGYYSSSFVPYDGIAFELSPQPNGTWTESILYPFPNTATDGGSPESGMVSDGQGNLYGTTIFGGNAASQFTTGGTVFELMPQSGGGWTEKVLHLFAATPTDGYETTAGVVFDGNGNLFGTTQAGGANGVGTVFEVASAAQSKSIPTVTVSLPASGITTGQALAVTVDVAGVGGSPLPTGPVTVTSGSYTSSPTALSSGAAMIDIPAGSLAIGVDTITATYPGDSNYREASGTAAVTVTNPAVLTSPAPGTTLSGSSVTFTWTAGSAVQAYQLNLGTNGTGTYNVYNSGHISTTSATVTALPTNGQTIYARLYSEIGGVWQFTDYTYAEAGSPVAATLSTPTPGSVLSGSSSTFTWTAGSGVASYQLFLGTTGVGSSNVYNSGHISGTSTSVTGIPIYGQKVYVRLYSEIGGAWQFADYTYTEAGSPVAATLSTPAPGSVLSGSSVSFTWTAGGGVASYQLFVGTGGVGSDNVYNSGHTSATSASVAGIPVYGQTVYVRLYSDESGVWSSVDYTYIEAGAPVPAALSTPAPGSVLSGSSVTFTWTTGGAVLEYQLYLGTTGVGSSNIYTSGHTFATSASVTGIPTFGQKVYARLYSDIGGVWQSTDYTYTEAGAPARAALTTPTPGTTLAGSSATFAWTAGGGVTSYQLVLGTTGLGSSNLYNSGHTTATSVSVTGLPTTGTKIYARLYSQISGAWQSTDYTYTEAAP